MLRSSFYENVGLTISIDDCSLEALAKLPDEHIAISAASRLEKLIALAHKHNFTIEQARKNLLTAGERVYWRIDDKLPGTFAFDESYERYVLVSDISKQENNLLIRGTASSLHAPKNLNIVCALENGDQAMAQISTSSADAIPCKVLNDYFEPIEFSCIIPAISTRFWLDVAGATSPLTIEFEDCATLSEGNSSFVMIGRHFIMLSRSRKMLVVQSANPVTIAKRSVMSTIVRMKNDNKT